MSVVIQFESVIGISVMGAPERGMMLSAYDPDAYDGAGESEWTTDPEKAMEFADAPEALGFWTKQSTVRPLLPGGQPNRPLTAYAITVGPPPERSSDEEG